jgi:hypothetical protein
MALVRVLAALALLAFAPAASAQAPSNDTNGGAPTIALNDPRAGDLLGAANDYELPGPGCFSGLGNVITDAPGPDVVYRFVAPSDGLYRFRVRRPAATADDLVLYAAAFLPSGPSPQPVDACVAAANRSVNGSSEELEPVPLAAGQAVRVVVDATAAVAASIPMQVLAERVGAESEPNGTPGTAASPTCGVGGAIAPADDRDFFSLGSPPAGSRVFALVDGGAAPDDDLNLRVTTAVDTLEFDDSNADYPFGADSALIAGTVLTAPGFLRVTHTDGAVETEPYRLYYVVQPPSPGIATESEPNGTTAQATPAPQGYIAGTLGSGEADVFSFTSPARALLFIALDADPTRTNSPFNGQIELLDADGAVIATANDPAGTSNTTSGAGTLQSATPFSPAEGLALRVPRGGTYYVRVTSAAGADDYILSISSACRAGTLPAPIDILPASVPDATEGSAYSMAFTATGGTGAHRFELASGTLPPGLTLGADGALSGTPTAAGSYPFTVAAVDADDAAGDRGYTLTVAPSGDPPAEEDTVAPRTTITRRPPNRGRSRRVTFRFASNEAGSRFQCKRDSKAFAACNSPKRYRLKRGRHRFRVRAVDPAGNVDPSPASDRFRILRRRR